MIHENWSPRGRRLLDGSCSPSSLDYLAGKFSYVWAWPLLATKAVRQKYQASPELLKLLDEFRRMVNVCVMIGIKQNISSLKALASRTYPCLSRDILGYKTLESTQRRLWCPHCGAILDRDENAARNIAARGLRFSPNEPPGEAMGGTGTGERDPNPQSRWRQVKSTSNYDNPSDKDLTEPRQTYMISTPHKCTSRLRYLFGSLF